MKVKVLSRNPEDYTRERKSDLHKLPRNLDPSLHPFEAAREYTRALNATKLERVFAKPFLGSLDGHRDGVHCMIRHPKSLSTIASGSCDGQIKVWNLATRECSRTFDAHRGFVRGICFSQGGDHLISVGDDKIVKYWSLNDESSSPVNSIIHKTVFLGIDHDWKNKFYATCGDVVDVWDEEKSVPIRSFAWGLDSVYSVKFNKVETNMMASTGSDRSVILYDVRGSHPLRKITMKMRGNAVAWNPLEAYIFTVANEDSNLYTFDTRKLNMPVNVHMDHVSAVLDVDYSPTGQEFVSGSFDKTIRIFPRDKGRSREVYYAKRMQRVFCVRFSGDTTYVLSGSDETNIRIWKTNASEIIGPQCSRQKEAMKYNNKLKDKYRHHPEIKRIARHRHLPKVVYKKTKEKRVMKEARDRREENMRLHSKPGAIPYVPERKKGIVGVEK